MPSKLHVTVWDGESKTLGRCSKNHVTMWSRECKTLSRCKNIGNYCCIFLCNWFFFPLQTSRILLGCFFPASTVGNVLISNRNKIPSHISCVRLFPFPTYNKSAADDFESIETKIISNFSICHSVFKGRLLQICLDVMESDLVATENSEDMDKPVHKPYTVLPGSLMSTYYKVEP